MTIQVHSAAFLNEVDPDQLDPDTVLNLVIPFWRHSLDVYGRLARPGFQMEDSIENWADEMDSIESACRNPEIRAGWRSAGHGRSIYNRLCEIEEQCYNGLLAHLEELEPDSPVHDVIRRYQEARALRAENNDPLYKIIEG